MKITRKLWFGLLALFAAVMASGPQASAQQQQKPNIVFIMGDDIGWSNIGVYNQGIMSGRTPNLDQLAAEGMRFTDYYAEASCTAGRANFITGELPIRTGLTTVGQAGSPLGIPDEAPTIATALKSMGYATGQFGKNHLGDLNQFLPTVHGFDEFFGYLYHLDAMEDPCHVNYPAALKETVGPRHMVHSFATDVDDQTVQPRWGKIGKQRVEDAGELCPKRMETVDDEILDNALKFVDKARRDGKPFFLWLNPTRMHVITHLSPKYQGMRNSDNNWSEEEAGMAQLDDIVGTVMKYLKDNGLEGNTIVGFTTDNGAENFTWPDGGQTPFAGGKGTALEGGFRVPMILRWPGKVPAGKVENAIVSGLDWFPTLVAAAGDPNIAAELQKGKQLGGRTYKVHLDGYDQTELPLHRSARRLAGWNGQGRLADPNQPPARSVRAHWYAERCGGILGLLQLVRVPVLAFPVCPERGCEDRPDRHRVPADAKGGELQPRGGESANREGDGVAHRSVRSAGAFVQTLPMAALFTALDGRRGSYSPIKSMAAPVVAPSRDVDVR